MDTVNLKRLSDEIKEFEKYLAPTPYENKCREDLFELIKDVVQWKYPHSNVEAFGSYETQLLLPSSDIDLNITAAMNVSARDILSKMRYSLTKKGLRIDLFVPQATVPVLKVSDPRTSLTADITAQNNVASSTRTLAWANEYPELKPLFLVLKHALLAIRFDWDPNYEVLSTVKNGLASYSLVCMIIHYLKYKDDDKDNDKNGDKGDSIKNQKKNHPMTRLGRLLMGFLSYFSSFDFEKNGIGFYSKQGVILKLDHLALKQAKEVHQVMLIENPDDTTSNVARATRTMKQLQAVLAWMHAKLHIAIESNYFRRSLLENIIKVDPHQPGKPRQSLAKYHFPLIRLTKDDVGTCLPSVDPNLFANKNKPVYRPKPWDKRKRVEYENDEDEYHYRPSKKRGYQTFNENKSRSPKQKRMKQNNAKKSVQLKK
ncbi:hypothetical protein BDA99DRAFT_504056 [Phascolomyces articulosus]|uniref:polynucleotide adenylyltransferase n=1 Tax=Phascolomyces articulosus TaxID=60185 RepID=A0AAD5KFW1_9FUNG|nr:hypothetical protein BDA99DRAFT_504056 [Phascolomyces articulosus]